MADLDDFFAKKDRKKNKSSKKFSTTEEVAKKLDETAKKTEKQKKERVPEGDENASQLTVSFNHALKKTVIIFSMFEVRTNHIVHCH